MHTSPIVFSTHPLPCWVKTACRWLSNRARAFRRFFSALALAVAMPSNASSRMPTIRRCSGSGGRGIGIEFSAFLSELRLGHASDVLIQLDALQIMLNELLG